MAAGLRPKRWLILLPIVLGLVVLVFLTRTRSGPEQTPLTEQARPVRVIEVPSVTVIPRALGYGNVEPGKVWEAVAEVGGKIVELHPRLKNGEIITADSLLLRIDPTDYELAVTEVETDIEATAAQLSELEVQEANTRASLQIEQEALRLSEKELERIRRLATQGTVTPSELEQQQRTTLAQRQNVQNLRNTLNLIPVQRKRLQAQLARYRAQLAGARLNLERTAIRMPFDGRIAAVNVELTQFVRQGEVLVTVDGVDVAEIVAQIPVGRMRTLIQADSRMPLADLSNLDVESAREILGLRAAVRLRVQDFEVEWDARFARLSEVIDPQTRTVGVIVTVDDPYRQAQPGIRPPLVKGMFVEVELRGRPRPDSLVVPRAALHENGVYVVNAQSRLEQRPVEVGIEQPSFVTIAAGLRAGERVVLSDLIPAIEGMLLKPVSDEEALSRLLRQAQGEQGSP